MIFFGAPRQNIRNLDCKSVIFSGAPRQNIGDLDYKSAPQINRISQNQQISGRSLKGTPFDFFNFWIPKIIN